MGKYVSPHSLLELRFIARDRITISQCFFFQPKSFKINPFLGAIDLTVVKLETYKSVMAKNGSYPLGHP